MPKTERIVALGEALVKTFSLERGKEYILEFEIGSKSRGVPLKEIIMKLGKCIESIIKKIDYVLHTMGLEPIILISTEVKDNFLKIHFKK